MIEITLVNEGCWLDRQSFPVIILVGREKSFWCSKKIQENLLKISGEGKSKGNVKKSLSYKYISRNS